MKMLKAASMVCGEHTGEWRVARANAAMVVNVGTWGMVEPLMSSRGRRFTA
jgi:hypothetical protein